MPKRLYRSRSERVLWGVCGGVAKYFDMDPVLVRIIFVLLIFANGLGILAYIIMAILVPLEGSQAAAARDTIRENVQEMKQSATELGEEIRSSLSKEGEPKNEVSPPIARDHRHRNILGIVLIIVGIFLLMMTLNLFAWLSWFRWAYLWPLILVVVGLIVILGARRR